MDDRIKMHIQMLDFISTNNTLTPENWTDYLKFASRFYKYSYAEQIGIYYQRPDATAVASYEIWNQQMRRYVKRGSVGIAILDANEDGYGFRYLFDIADTGTRRNSRNPNIWTMLPEHEDSIVQHLDQKYDIPVDIGPLENHLQVLAMELVSDYWNDHKQDLLDNIADSFMSVYDENTLGISFRRAATNSVLYQLFNRCFGNPDDFIGPEEFVEVRDFNTPTTAIVLGTAVNTVSAQILREIEITVRSYNRDKERSQTHEYQSGIYSQRGLSDPRPVTEQHTASASEQVRTDAPDISDGTQADHLLGDAGTGETVRASVGDSGDSPAETGSADAGTVESESGAEQNRESDGLGTAHEQPESTGGRNDLLGADLQLIIEEPVIVGEQFSLFASEAEQIQVIDEAERTEMVPSAFSLPQDTIDTFLRVGGNSRDHRQRIAAEYQKQKNLSQIAEILPKIFVGSHGLKLDNGDVAAWYHEDGIHLMVGRSARYSKSAQILTWEDAATRIGQLLNEGHFASNVELAEAAHHERDILADALIFAERDAHDGFLTTVGSVKGGFPEQKEKVIEYLANPDSLAQITKEYTDLYKAYKAGQNVTHYRLHRADEIMMGLLDLTLPRKEYATEWSEVPTPQGFITEDEINYLISGGAHVTSSKERIFDFYSKPHSSKDAITFLKNEYGISGHNGALPGSFLSDVSYEGKGMRLKKPHCADVEMKWATFDKYVTALIESNRYLSVEEAAARRAAHAEETELLSEVDADTELETGTVDVSDSGTVVETTEDVPDTKDLTDLEYAYRYITPGETTYEKDGSTFLIDRINPESSTINVQDISFVHPSGAPIFRVEPIAIARRVLDESAAEQLNEAMQLIDAFCQQEYEEAADFVDLEHIGIGFTTVTDNEYPIEVEADLNHYRIERSLNGQLLDIRQYQSLIQMINEELRYLDFSELVSVSDGDLVRVLGDDAPVEDPEIEAESPTTTQPEDLPVLPNTAKAEYDAIRSNQDSSVLIGFQQGNMYEFYDDDALQVSESLGHYLLGKRLESGSSIPVSGFPADNWAHYGNKLWSEGHSILLMGENPDGTHHVAHEYNGEEYLPIGAKLGIDDRQFEIDSVDFRARTVSLKDITFQNGTGFPIFRVEPIEFVRQIWEETEHPIEVTPNFIDHFYVVKDLDAPDLELTEHATFEEALFHYRQLPTQAAKALGAQNTARLPGSLDFIQSVFDANRNKYRDVLISDYLRVPGWDNDEVAKIVNDVERFLDEKPLLDVPAENYRITDENLGVGGAKEKFRRNMDAINLLHELEFDGRQATPAEQETLSKYVGWGGLADAFDESKSDWADEFTELYTALSPEEYKAARASTLNAHYTSPVVIKAMYDAIANMGFESGNVLEPAMGVGNFFGMLPEQMQGSRLYGVELDDVSGRIAKQLYPKANITISGFEKTDRKDFFDLAIGNVPFGQYKVNDPAFNKLGFSIHNYFFAKGLDQLRPGGVMAFITSRYTMDSKDDSVRKYIAERAQLLGAIRLPNTAFKANAGTDVVSDIIFLQKREQPIAYEPDWVSLGTNKDGYSINRYFIDNPHMVMGVESEESTRFGMDYTVAPSNERSLSEQLSDAIRHIDGVYEAAELPDLGEGEELRETIPADPNVRNFSYTLVDGEIYYRENSIMAKPKLKAATKDRVRGMIGLRNCVRELIDLQMDSRTSDAEIAAKQAELNQLYDDFSAVHGLINSKGNRIAFSDDSSYYLLCSLEELDEDHNLLRKADMFTKRTIREAQAVTSVDTASEALAVSISEHACVDMPYMASLSNKTMDELASELRGVIFQVPGSVDENGNPEYVTADEYLSGNVREKLIVARNAAETSPVFQDNVEALEKAQPKELEASEIDVRLGATWIDKKYIQEFMEELLQPPFYLRRSIQVNYSPYTADWNITGKSNVSWRDVNANTTYGTSRINAYHIMEDSLNLRDVRVYDTIIDPDGKERRVINQKETTLAQQKQQAIRDAFKDWIWKDPDRRQTLVQLYNEKFNSTRPREYDGSHITFGGMSPEISLREHQKNAIAHILYGGNTLLAHEVGSGKTFEMVAAAMESKRLGLCSKSLIVVPNHLIEQWASEFLRLYPSANILVARKKDFEPARRKTFCSKIATGDYDAVIIGHSQFEKIPMSMERQKAMIQKQIDDVEDGIEELRSSGAERFTVKSLERTRKSLENRLEKLTSSKRKDDVVTFEQLGVDRLFVDEAHNYKNLFLYTKMQNVAGISTTDAQKSSDMYMKCQYLDQKTGGRGVIFATGTPISNSMTELYTMMRYLQSNTLQEKGWAHFDCWAAHFGETKSVTELAPEGTGYRVRTRFAKFYNLPELINIWKEAADVKTADQLHLPRPDAVYHNEVAKPTESQKNLVAELSERAAAVHSGTVDSREDNMLKITSDGRKLGLDQRIVSPYLPDEAGTKINLCVENVLRIWREGQADKLTQLVFCDISTPKAKSAPKKKGAEQSEDLTETPAVDVLAALNATNSDFIAYEDIRSKLIAGGMPPEQIAFIHDANTDARKKELFAKVRSGQVRVLLGSTFKMGAGMNVQDRLIALHDLDCPWRPGDLEQRSGRIIRQGNMNKEVHIYRYVTEGTFDSYLWQTVENKQKFISQIMTSKSPVRSCEDVDETALSYAEIKALCAGNPAIKEKMDLDIEVSRLKVLKADHQSQQFRMEDNLLKYYPEQISKLQGVIAGLEADIKIASEHPHPEDGFAGITIRGDKLIDKENAATAFMEAIKLARGPEPVKIGSYRGFEMSVTLENFGKDFVLKLSSQLSHKITLGNDGRGNLIRMDNAIRDFTRLLEVSQSQLQNVQEQVELTKAELGKPFPHEEELFQKTQRLTELNAMLDMDGKRNSSERDAEDISDEERPSVIADLHRLSAETPAVRKTEQSRNVEER